jgi:phosphatidylserine/phosphatidylglycerophosphate/cardiolipin synthase-like enzyme
VIELILILHNYTLTYKHKKLFSNEANEHPEKVLVGVIDEAKTTLDIAIYSLTHPDIIQAISDAKKRGVVVNQDFL